MTNTFAALQDLLLARHSCRAFRSDPVPRETVTRIMEAAQRVPSWCNAQPWQVIVTDGDATDRFRAEMQRALTEDTAKSDFDPPAGYSGPYQERRRTCGFQLYEAVGVARGDRPAYARQMAENYRLFGAPHVAIITTPAELGPYGAVDCGGYVTAFCLAAEACGVATVPQAALAFYAEAVRAHFDIPDDRLVLCAISFGYADRDHPANAFRTERAPVKDVLDWRD